jgi:membrane-bound serine protease (ClpP class)
MMPLGITSAQSQDPLQAESSSASTDPKAKRTELGTVGYVHIAGVIDRMRHRYLERSIESAGEDGIDTLIVHIDTDGGEVFYARQMLKLILDQKREERRMIAFIDFRAISAGAMIAYGHEAIYISETASIGDIGVIFVAQGGEMKYAPEKIQTVVRALLKLAAETRGWNKALLLKMTARNQKLYRVRMANGEEAYVIEDDMPDFLVQHPEIDKEDSTQVIVYRGEDRLLTLTGREATKLGMATGLAPDLESLYQRLDIDPTNVVDLSPSVVEMAASHLAGIAPLLAGLALMFILFELKTPGVGLWALLAGVCGASFLVSQYFLDMAESIEVVLLALGVLLVVVEFLTLAGGGVIGLAGGLLVIAGLVMLFMPNEFEFDPSDEQYLQALGSAAMSTTMAIAVMALGSVALIYLLPRSGLARRLAVEAEVTGSAAGSLERSAANLIGDRGEAREAMRPSGLVIIDGEEYSAHAEYGAFIDAGAAVRVVAVQFGELVVRADEEQPAGNDAK